MASLYKKLWAVYLNISKGEKIDIRDLEILLKKATPKNYSVETRNIMLVFNSGRLANADILQKVSIKRHQLNGQDISNSRLYCLDAQFKKNFQARFSLRLNTLVWILSHFPTFILGLINERSLAGSLIMVYQKVFELRDIDKLDLFTSNNRLTELLRIAAIGAGVQVTEYLHGICSNIFADYYRLIHLMAADRQLSYVNMAPCLPQPPIIQENLATYKDRQVVFQNESQWLPYSSEFLSDVLIVGSNIANAKYSESSLFSNDLSFINFCLDRKLKVVYCPHPSTYNEVRFKIPRGALIGRFHDYVNSTKILVGHYSTALFVAHLFGKKILIFKDAFEMIPDYFFDKLLNKFEVGFDEWKLISALESEVLTSSVKNIKNQPEYFLLESDVL